MAYIGNTVENQGFTPAIDYFNGDGVTVTFTLSRPIASVAQVIVAIDNVIQNPSSSYTVAGSAITFSSAPLSGTNNIWVEYTSLITTYNAISQDPTVIGDIRATGGYLAEGDFGNSFVDGTILDYVTGRGRVTVGSLDDITFYHGGTSARSEMMDLYYAGGAKIYGTTALTIPVGTTAQRPTGATGMIRMNSTTGSPEWYDASSASWIRFNQAIPYSVDYLVISGGGGGGSSGGASAGGGGAGGFLSGTSTIGSTPTYTVTVGAAGTAGSGGGFGGDGGVSSFNAIAPVGGGGGGAGGNNGRSGGSGGGGGTNSAVGGSGTAGQGNAGGTAETDGNYRSGGGGGAGAAGANGTAGGAGGAGTDAYSTWASATSTGVSGYYAGGGGGGVYSGGGGGGGAGGGGSANSGSATANTGSGGAGSRVGSGGSGGSGIVIIRYLGAQRGTGGTVTSSGGYTYHTFTSSGTYTV